MDNYLTQLYMKFFCERLSECAPELFGKGQILYKANIHYSCCSEEAKSVLQVAGAAPRSLSFRLADIIKYHREKLWSAPAFIYPVEGEGVSVTDNIIIGSGVRLGLLADRTAAAVSIFLEKYLIKG